ncbi:MAG: cyclic nucleotide-binding domain-containing protein [Rhodocyclaceae bacterium]|nr:cyclic nucleotide-binding domain-containing protein [Rhodocyclaceae bacterium]
MRGERVLFDVISRLQPLAELSPACRRELATLCRVEHVPRNHDPFRVLDYSGQSVYLLKGELKLSLCNDSSEVLVGGSDTACRPLGNPPHEFLAAKAITDVELVRIDNEVLDILVTWDRIATEFDSPRDAGAPKTRLNWREMSGVFNLRTLTRGPFAALPSAHVNQLFERMERIPVSKGQTVVTEGEPGDYYYVIEEGAASVTRRVGANEIRVAELKSGDAFGEEALVADAPRNASVCMTRDGVLYRLEKNAFTELLRVPLLHVIEYNEACVLAQKGAQWVDVRFPAEFMGAHLPGAINIPLGEIRNGYQSLDRQRTYLVYCQSGRRSSAAAFLLAQHGFDAYLLRGGLPHIDPTGSKH